MDKAPKAQKKVVSEIEVEPDAWARFRRAIRVAVKAGPQHRKAELKQRGKKAAIALFAILAMPLPARAAEVWISCVPMESGGIGTDGKLEFRPITAQEQRELTEIFMINGQSVYFYAPERRTINQANGTVAPGAIELRESGIYSIIIDRLSGKFSSSHGADVRAGRSVNGECVVIAAQPIADTKF